jgi:hypothetical protein
MKRLDPAPRAGLINHWTSDLWLKVVAERFNIYQGTADPVLAEVPKNQWLLHKNSTSGEVAFFLNDNGTLYKVNLTSGSVGVLPHHVTHESGGVDAIKLDDLAAPEDNTDLNATTLAHGLLPKLSGNAGDVLAGDGTWVASAGGGDVVGPASSVDNRVVFFNGITGKLIKDSGLTLSGSNTGDQTITLTGDVNGSGTGSFAATIQPNSVTYAKMQDVAAASRLIGRGDSGSGDPPEITLGSGLTMTGTTLSVSGGSGDVVGPASAVNNNVVFFDGTTGKLIKDSGLALSGTNTGDQTITLTGNVTGSGTGSFAATIANDAVTYAKMQNVSVTQRLLGRNTAGAGDVEEVTVTQALDWFSTTQGVILFRGAANWGTLGVGSAGQVLQTNGAGANPSWVSTKRMLANVTLGGAGTSLASGTITACQFLEIHIWIEGYAGSDTASFQFNSDTGNNYRYRWLTSAAGATTFTAGLVAASTDRIKVAAVNTTSRRRIVAFISNDSSITEKLVTFSEVTGTGAVGTQSTLDLGNGAWVSAAATQITSVSLISGSNMTAGTQMTIFGWN